VAGQEFKNRIRIYKDFADLPNIECKPRELNQVLLNLLVNAAGQLKETEKSKSKLLKKAAKLCSNLETMAGAFHKIILREFFNPSFST